VATIGVVPAAGYATRLQPLQCSKEVFPVHGRPVMDYLLERMWAAGPREVRVVTRPDKTDVADHARAMGATVIEAQPASLADSFAAGIGDAAPTDVILMGFPDSIWEPVDGYEQILALLDRGFEVALGLFKPEEADLRRFETVLADSSGLVRQIDVKPPVPTSRWIWGCAAVRARALADLRGETEPGVLFNSLCAEGVVGGTALSESYVDMGTHDGLRQALEATGD
jgi:glucose-1-phosphate thymidylyltransferase